MANTAQTVEREAPQAAEVKWQKPSKFKHFLKTAWDCKILLAMLLPALTYVVIFSYIPMTGIVLAFKKYNYVDGIYGSPWVGFDNFKFLIISDKLWPLTRNTLLYNIAFIFLGMFLAVAFAIVINELTNKVFKKIFQSFMFLPYFISWVVVQAIFQAIFGYEYGIFNHIIEFFGAERINFYASPDGWPVLLVFFKMWKMVGYDCIVYLAAVAGIDQGMYEAAAIDGANIWQRIRHITLPSLLPTMIIMGLLAVGQIFRGDFGLFYQLVGNNAVILKAADILDTFIYRSLMQTSDYGMSSAAGLYQSCLCFVTILVVNKIVKMIEPDYTLF